MKISQTNGCERGSCIPDFPLMFAQLRDVLTAEDSTVMPKKDQYGWTVFPKRTELAVAPIRVREGDWRKCCG